MSLLKDTDQGQSTENPKPYKRTWWYRILAFIKHKTVWRIIAIAGAVAATVLSGGAAIPAIMLATTFLASLIGVVGKIGQVRTLEKYKLQATMTKTIKTTKEKLEALRIKYPKILDIVSPKKIPENHHSIKVEELDHNKAVLKTLRDVGLENAISLLAFGSVSNIVGTLAYAVGVGASIKNIKEEFDVRVQTELDKNQAKLEINEACKGAGIAPYKNTKELSARFREEMIEFEAQKELCEKIEKKYQGRELTEAERHDIQREYADIKDRLSKEITVHLPEEVTFGRKLLDAVNPFKMEQVNRFENIDLDKTYTIIPSKTTETKTAGLTPVATPQQIAQDQPHSLLK